MQDILQSKGTPKICTSSLVIKDNKILLGLRNYTSDKWKTVSVWTTPGGRCDEEEVIGDNLIRETQEETGINDLVIKEYLGLVEGAKEGDKVHVFLCFSNQEPELMEPEKFSKWQWFESAQIPENFINKNILEIIKLKGL
jgi:ADP-ribose pyrophosphatase YjhB (NUDIX family)